MNNEKKECSMKVGDLAYTQKGNLVIITHIEKEWVNIVFTSNGNQRYGFPREWIRRVK